MLSHFNTSGIVLAVYCLSSRISGSHAGQRSPGKWKCPSGNERAFPWFLARDIGLFSHYRRMTPAEPPWPQTFFQEYQPNSILTNLTFEYYQKERKGRYSILLSSFVPKLPLYSKIHEHIIVQNWSLNFLSRPISVTSPAFCQRC
jgi:hypothetical protein